VPQVRSAGVGEVERVEDLGGANCGVGLAHAEQAALDDELLAAGGLAVGAARLGHVADPAANLARLAGDVEAGHARGAGGRRQQRGEDAQRRGLARAVGPEEAEDVAGADAEVTPATASTAPPRP
jgi:hypothetical protein